MLTKERLISLFNLLHHLNTVTLLQKGVIQSVLIEQLYYSLKFQKTKIFYFIDFE